MKNVLSSEGSQTAFEFLNLIEAVVNEISVDGDPDTCERIRETLERRVVDEIKRVDGRVKVPLRIVGSIDAMEKGEG
jgi:hypothetical protein